MSRTLRCRRTKTRLRGRDRGSGVHVPVRTSVEYSGPFRETAGVSMASIFFVGDAGVRSRRRRSDQLHTVRREDLTNRGNDRSLVRLAPGRHGPEPLAVGLTIQLHNVGPSNIFPSEHDQGLRAHPCRRLPATPSQFDDTHPVDERARRPDSPMASSAPRRLTRGCRRGDRGPGSPNQSRARRSQATSWRRRSRQSPGPLACRPAAMSARYCWRTRTGRGPRRSKKLETAQVRRPARTGARARSSTTGR